MSWSERFLFGINTVHNLYLFAGIAVCALGLVVESNFPDLIYMYVTETQSGFSYGVVMLAICAGFLGSSINIPNDTPIGQMGVRVVTRLVFWGASLIFLMDMLNDLHGMAGLELLTNLHLYQIIGLFSYILPAYILMALGWQATTCIELCKKIKAEKGGVGYE